MKFLFACFAVFLGLWVTSFAPVLAAEKSVYVLEVKGPIGPATADFIVKNLKVAENKQAAAVVLAMHTPGGLVTSMQDIIQAILAAEVPVVTYVSPPGSHAASAGTYILYASHIAAMAPSTNIGAATPVMMGGGGGGFPDMGGDKKQEKPQDGSSSLEKKATNDAAAYIRGLAELRGRNIEWAEKAVREAVSVTADEALKDKIIDIVAADVPELLKKMDGRVIKLQNGKQVKLDTEKAKIENIYPDWRTEILSVITNPNVAFLLMTLGAYGIIYEFSHPGAFFPGVVGIICLTVGLFALNVLPVNMAGLALIFLGLALMTAEAFVTSFGILGVGGTVAFVLGATILIDSDIPGFGISPWTIALAAGTSITILIVLLSMALRAQKKPVTTGVEEIVGSYAEVTEWRGNQGAVRVTGEIWQAYSVGEFGFKKGDYVKVSEVNGLKLAVVPRD